MRRVLMKRRPGQVGETDAVHHGHQEDRDHRGGSTHDKGGCDIAAQHMRDQEVEEHRGAAKREQEEAERARKQAEDEKTQAALSAALGDL
mgnify:CR=1 FL=1